VAYPGQRGLDLRLSPRRRLRYDRSAAEGGGQDLRHIAAVLLQVRLDERLDRRSVLGIEVAAVHEMFDQRPRFARAPA
jgi:hypothetical protein